MKLEDIYKTMDYSWVLFNQIELPFCLGGSMLKGILCQGRPYETDTEIDFYVFAEDLKKVWNSASKIDGAKLLPGDQVEFRAFHIAENKDHGLITCGVMYEHDLGLYFNTAYNDFICIPKKGYQPYKRYFFNNKWWNIPGNYPDIYNLFYGKNWQEDNPNYHWKLSGALISADTLDELDVKWRKREEVNHG